MLASIKNSSDVLALATRSFGDSALKFVVSCILSTKGMPSNAVGLTRVLCAQPTTTQNVFSLRSYLHMAGVAASLFIAQVIEDKPIRDWAHQDCIGQSMDSERPCSPLNHSTDSYITMPLWFYWWYPAYSWPQLLKLSNMLLKRASFYHSEYYASIWENSR